MEKCIKLVAGAVWVPEVAAILLPSDNSDNSGEEAISTHQVAIDVNESSDINNCGKTINNVDSSIYASAEDGFASVRESLYTSAQSKNKIESKKDVVSLKVEKAIEVVMSQANCSREDAVAALNNYQNDIVEAIMSLEDSGDNFKTANADPLVEAQNEGSGLDKDDTIVPKVGDELDGMGLANQEGSSDTGQSSIQRIGGYVIEKELGEGGFGLVLQGKPIDGKGPPVAIKQCLTNGSRNSEKSKRRYLTALKEALILQPLRHEHIIQYKEMVPYNGGVYVVMELATGGDLRKQIKNQKEKGTPWSTSHIKDWFAQIVSGVKYLHDNQVMHRDLKPHNVLISEDSLLTIADFGLAKVMDEGTVNAVTRCGTRSYMSPQAQNGDKYTFSADVWSLGCILFELCMLEVAFTRIQNVFSKKTTPKICKISPNGENWKLFRNMCKQMLSQDPSQRPSCLRLLESLGVVSHDSVHISDITLQSSDAITADSMTSHDSVSSKSKRSTIISKRFSFSTFKYPEMPHYSLTSDDPEERKRRLEEWDRIKNMPSSEEQITTRTTSRPGVLTRARNNMQEFVTGELHKALMKACEEGNDEAVQELLARPEINVNRQGQDGLTPLDIAISNDKLAIVEQLLAHSKINVKNANVFLQKSSGSNKALMKACQEGNDEAVQELLARPEINVNKKGEKFTPLIESSRRGFDKVVGKLLAHPQIEVNKMRHGWFALFDACWRGHAEVVRQLLAHPEINVNQQGPFDGLTSLSTVSAYGRLDIGQQLLDHPDIEVNLGAKHNESPLFWASRNNHLQIVRLLLARPEINVHKKSTRLSSFLNIKEGDTALDIAVRSDHREIVQLLQSHINRSSKN